MPNKIYVWKFEVAAWCWEIAPADALPPGHQIHELPTQAIVESGTETNQPAAITAGLLALRHH